MLAQQIAFNIRRANPKAPWLVFQEYNYINWKNQYKITEHMQGYATSSLLIQNNIRKDSGSTSR